MHLSTLAAVASAVVAVQAAPPHHRRVVSSGFCKISKVTGSICNVRGTVKTSAVVNEAQSAASNTFEQCRDKCKATPKYCKSFNWNQSAKKCGFATKTVAAQVFKANKDAAKTWTDAKCITCPNAKNVPTLWYGSFEGPDIAPWQVGPDGSNAIITPGENTAHADQLTPPVGGSTAASTYIAQNFNWGLNTTYTLDFDYRFTVEQSAVLTVNAGQDFSNAGNVYSDETFSIDTNVTDWRHATINITAPAANGYVRFTESSFATPVPLQVDNVIFAPLPV